MAEVSLEAESGKPSGEDPQLDSEVEEEENEVAEETLTEDRKQESVDSNVGGDDPDRAMDEIDIDGTEDNIETSDQRMQEVDLGSQSESVVTSDDSEAARSSGSVGNGGLEAERHAERAEAPEESGEADAATKVIFSLTLDNQPFQAAPRYSLLLIWQFSFLSALVVVACPLLK